ncbi:arsenate reductase ArsC [Maricaulaceae bacterium EIL42A08]|nr:arsenate reductase ArsC [Maricaulaceae bacterium EIL42A08]MCP2680521.1 arsenate reductase ArsC [Maricaulaceae bacterium NA33B04]
MNILILCTGNSARSIMGEALFTARSNGQIQGYSAGSNPTGTPNPYAIETLQRHGIDTGFARSKSWDEFDAADAPVMDAVITVCDSAASETCPVWPGAPVRAHWGLPDPAAITQPDAARAAFEETYQKLAAAVDAVLSSPDWASGGGALKAALDRARPAA